MKICTAGDEIFILNPIKKATQENSKNNKGDEYTYARLKYHIRLPEEFIGKYIKIRLEVVKDGDNKTKHTEQQGSTETPTGKLEGQQGTTEQRKLTDTGERELSNNKGKERRKSRSGHIGTSFIQISTDDSISSEQLLRELQPKP